MAMSGFICHDDYLNKTAKLTDEEVGRLFRALMRYHATHEEAEITGRESIAFDFIREDIDRTDDAYKAKCEKNRNTRLAAIDNIRQRSSTNDNVCPQKEKEKDKEKTINKSDSKPLTRFTPPTVDEVRTYCTERGNGVDPQRFVDYYQARGWELKPGQKVKDWRACVRTWERNNAGTITGTVKPTNFGAFSQRSYAGQEESMEEVLARLKSS